MSSSAISRGLAAALLCGVASMAGMALTAPALAVPAGQVAVGSPQAESAAMDRGRQLSEAFLDGEIAGLWEAMGPQLREALGSADGLAAFRDGLADQLGAEAEIIDESVVSGEDGVATYNRTARWSGTEADVLMQWSVDAEGTILGFQVQPVPQLADSAYLDYQTQAALRLPFEGEWYVYWGGRTLEENYHAADAAQRFAADFVIVRDGASHAGDPQDLASYYCWDQPILASATGQVVAATGDLPDQAIGATDPENPAGNHVVIDLGNSEYLFLAHLREGSVTVAAGDTVQQGDEIGRCGNSGNTSEPHLHVHLQTTPDLTEGEGLPAQFTDYLADGDAVERGEPLQGQTIAPAPAS